MRLKQVALLALAFVSTLGLLRVLAPPLRDGISLSQAVYDRNQRLLRLTLTRDEKYRLWVPLSEISKEMKEATLLLEDQHFYTHLGVNPVALVRAFWTTYARGLRRVGGSTLSMQLARLRYGIRSRTVAGKIHQILRALQLEALHTKDEILEAYLNLAPYGANIEGVGAAGLVYFQRQAKSLTLPEAMTLAVIPQNPVRRSLNKTEQNYAIEVARRHLFERWREKHRPNPDAELQMKLPVRSLSTRSVPFLAPHYAETLLMSSEEDSIQGTLDLRLQRIVETQVRSYLEASRGLGLKNATALLLDRETMEVRAWLGSADYANVEIHGQVNGVFAKRSPGSALKPFLYGLAIEQGLIHPLSVLKDAPTSFGAFDPENFDGEFTGPLTATEALVRSRNIPAVSLASRLKEQTLYGFLKAAGVTRLREEKFYGLAISLGGAETSMAELVKLYALLGNGGILKPIRLKKSAPTVLGERLVSEEASYLVRRMLEENPRPGQQFQTDWTRDQLPVAWKTGTSHGFRDAWALGIFGKFVLGIWLGNFSGEGSPAIIGREAAGPLFFRIVDAVRSAEHLKPELTLDRPASLVRTEICAVSGSLPGAHCKHKRSTWFIPGKSPIATCEIHRQILVDRDSGLRTCPTVSRDPRFDIYEFWPSDLLKLFRLAGIPRRTPPPFDPGCGINERSERGLPPAILSPKEDLVYMLRATAPTAEQKISLSARTDADARELFWFVNNEFVGKGSVGQPLFWYPRPGHSTIRVVDDQGRTDSRDIDVGVVN